MSATPLEAGGFKALKAERERRREAERQVRELTDQLATFKHPQKLWDRVKAAEESRDAWEFRAHQNGSSVKWFKAEAQKYRDLYEQATTSNNIYAD